LDDEVKDDEMGMACNTDGNSYRLLAGKPEGKKQVGRPRRRWIFDINLDLGEIGLVVWTGSGSV
jgi:hypothetical protein